MDSPTEQNVEDFSGQSWDNFHHPTRHLMYVPFLYLLDKKQVPIYFKALF